MKDLTFRNKPVGDFDWEGKGVDSFFIDATWLGYGMSLSDQELMELTESDAGQEWLV